MRVRRVVAWSTGSTVALGLMLQHGFRRRAQELVDHWWESTGHRALRTYAATLTGGNETSEEAARIDASVYEYVSGYAPRLLLQLVLHELRSTSDAPVANEWIERFESWLLRDYTDVEPVFHEHGLNHYDLRRAFEVAVRQVAQG